MIWRKFTIHTTTEAEDILSADLADLGIDGVQIEDKVPLSDADTKGMFIDILPDIGPDDGTADVSFYVEVLDPESKQDRLKQVEKFANDPSVDASYMPNASNIYTESELKKLIEDVKRVIAEIGLYCNIGEGSIDVSNTDLINHKRFEGLVTWNHEVFEWLDIDTIKEQYLYPLFIKEKINDLPEYFEMLTEYEY